jgi:hypothetical protein
LISGSFEQNYIYHVFEHALGLGPLPNTGDGTSKKTIIDEDGDGDGDSRNGRKPHDKTTIFFVVWTVLLVVATAGTALYHVSARRKRAAYSPGQALLRSNDMDMVLDDTFPDGRVEASPDSDVIP